MLSRQTQEDPEAVDGLDQHGGVLAPVAHDHRYCGFYRGGKWEQICANEPPDPGNELVHCTRRTSKVIDAFHSPAKLTIPGPCTMSCDAVIFICDRETDCEASSGLPINCYCRVSWLGYDLFDERWPRR